MIESLKSVVLTSEDPDRVAEFYRKVLGLDLGKHRHRGVNPHWACQLGAQHIAIHPREGFWLPADPGGAIVSFDVASCVEAEKELDKRGVPVVARNRIGPMEFLAVRDPDGRVVCLGERWPERPARS